MNETEPSIDLLQHIYVWRRYAHQIEFFYLMVRNENTLVVDTLISAGCWKSSWFYVSSAWEYPEPSDWVARCFIEKCLLFGMLALLLAFGVAVCRHV